MSFSDGGNIASGGSTANNQANLTVATTVAVSAGDLVIVAVVVDNQNATGGDQGDVSGVTIGGVALTKARQHAQAVTAQTGAATSLWWGQPGALSSGVNIVATFANATTSDASALTARKFTVPSGSTVTKVGDNAGVSTTTAAGSLDFTGANVEHLRVRAVGCEFDTTQSLTVTGSWTAWTEAGSAASGTTTEAVIEVEHRIVTGTTGASAPTLGSACDSASVYAAFRETSNGTLAIAGSSTVAFVGSAILPADLPTFTNVSPVQFQRTTLYPLLIEPAPGAFIGAAKEVRLSSVATEVTVTFSQTRLYPLLLEPPAPLANIQSGTLAVSGSSSLAFIGSSVLSGSPAISGLTTVAFIGQSNRAGSLTISGSTTVSFNGEAIAAGTLTVSLGTAVAWVGSSISVNSGSMVVSGSTTVAFIGQSNVAGTLSVSGSTTAAFSGVAVKPTTLTIAGSTTVAFTGSSTAAGTLAIAGSTTAVFGGSALKPTTLTIAGSTTIAFTGRSTAAATLGVSLGTAVAWVGSFTAAGTGLMLISGSTTVAFTGRSTAAGTAIIGGSSDAAFTGRATSQASTAIVGTTSVAWVGSSVATLSGTYTISGSTAITWLGVGVLPAIDAALTIGGSTELTFIGENATAFVPPPEGYESQVGVWHVREVPRRGGRSRWSGRTGKRYRIYGTIFEQPAPAAPLWILDNGYWHDDGIWIDTKTWED